MSRAAVAAIAIVAAGVVLVIMGRNTKPRARVQPAGANDIPGVISPPDIFTGPQEWDA